MDEVNESRLERVEYRKKIVDKEVILEERGK